MLSRFNLTEDVQVLTTKIPSYTICFKKCDVFVTFCLLTSSRKFMINVLMLFMVY